MDAAIGLHLGQQALPVGRAQLLHLPVGQQRLDDGMGAAQALEGLGVGGEAGLGLLARGEAQLVVEHGAQLRRGVDVEVVAGAFLHLGLEGGDRGLEGVGDRLQLGPVDADARHLHFGQDPHERRLDVVVQHDHVLGLEALPEARRHGGDVARLAGRLLRHVPRRLPGLDDVEGELAGLLPQLRELVFAGRRIEQVGRHRGVHLEPRDVDAEREQRPHGLLEVVADDGAGEDAVELLGHRGRAELVPRHQHAEAGLVALRRHQDERHQVAAPGHAVPAGGQRDRSAAELAEPLR